MEGLTNLHTLVIVMTQDMPSDETPPCRVFGTLARGLPTLQQLNHLSLAHYGDLDDQGYDDYGGLKAGDVQAIGRSLKAWSLPNLHAPRVRYNHNAISIDSMGLDALGLRMCWQALGLPEKAA